MQVAPVSFFFEFESTGEDRWDRHIANRVGRAMLRYTFNGMKVFSASTHPPIDPDAFCNVPFFGYDCRSCTLIPPLKYLPPFGVCRIFGAEALLVGEPIGEARNCMGEYKIELPFRCEKREVQIHICGQTMPPVWKKRLRIAEACRS